MCTVITLQRPGHAWPLLLAANRDERTDRPWDPPASYWPNRPAATGGRDRLSGGTWMACNGMGMVAAVLNRTGSLGPAPGKRSRGELPLMALDFETAGNAATQLSHQDGSDYRSFNLIIVDRESVWFLRGTGAAPIMAIQLSPGLHMVTAHDPDDLTSQRVARHLPRFAAARAPEPPDWSTWPTLLADEAGPRAAALSVPAADGFGTVCTSLLGLPQTGHAEWLFAGGPASAAAFSPVALPG